MLKNRQKLLLNDLENTKNLITAQTLAEKYGISLRTIRNDIDKIAFYCKENNLNFVRVPGAGMRIVSKGNTTRNHKNSLLCNKFFEYEKDDRKLLLILCFLYLPSPITSELLCELFDISKGTLLNEIKEANDAFTNDEQIFGKKNKGYYLYVKESADLIYLLGRIIKTYDSSVVKNTIFNLENNLLSKNEIDIVKQCVDYISDNMLLFSNERLSLEVSMALLIKIIDKNEEVGHSYKISDNIKNFVSFIEFKLNKRMSKEDIKCLELILNMYTDIYKSNLKDNENLKKAISALIDEMALIYSDLEDEKDILQVDLANHIKSQLISKKFNVENENKLLKDIKTRYSNIFNDVKNSMKPFKKYYNIDFNDDEIGYITLYFCKSLDKIQKIKEAKVMVVCNTGRGASQFLATRIMNNCPEIHIVAMNSYLDIEKDSDILKI